MHVRKVVRDSVQLSQEMMVWPEYHHCQKWFIIFFVAQGHEQDAKKSTNKISFLKNNVIVQSQFRRRYKSILLNLDAVSAASGDDGQSHC